MNDKNWKEVIIDEIETCYKGENIICDRPRLRGIILKVVSEHLKKYEEFKLQEPSDITTNF
jgi:hypothetical protein